jgi:hypothetical protein
MCVGRPGGLEGLIFALRRFQHAGDTAAKAAAIAIGVRPHLGDDHTPTAALDDGLGRRFSRAYSGGSRVRRTEAIAALAEAGMTPWPGSDAMR